MSPPNSSSVPTPNPSSTPSNNNSSEESCKVNEEERDDANSTTSASQSSHQIPSSCPFAAMREWAVSSSRAGVTSSTSSSTTPGSQLHQHTVLQSSSLLSSKTNNMSVPSSCSSSASLSSSLVPSQSTEKARQGVTISDITVTSQLIRSRPSRGLHLSRNPQDLMIPVSVFSKAFPFHFLCDSDLRLLQIGSG